MLHEEPCVHALQVQRVQLSLPPHVRGDGDGGGGNREKLGKVTECCNCANEKVLAPLPPRKCGGTAAAKGAQEDRAADIQVATNPKPRKAARGAARGATQAVGQGHLSSYF